MPAEEFLVLRHGDHQNAVALPDTFPEILPDVVGQCRFVSLVQIARSGRADGVVAEAFPKETYHTSIAVIVAQALVISDSHPSVTIHRR